MVTRTAALLIGALVFALAANAGELPGRSRGETVYVPAYSHIYHGNLDGKGRPQVVLLSSMLSIRNVDPNHGITVSSVRYYYNDGKLLREYYEAPLTLGPLGSTDVFVEHRDSAGGAGANFLVVWDSRTPVNPPIVETVNSYFFGGQFGIFASRGRAIHPGGD